MAERRPLALPLSPGPFLGPRLVPTSSASVAVPGRIEELKMCRCGCEINDLVEAYLESLDGRARSGSASVRIADHARQHGPVAYAAVCQAAEQAVRLAGGLLLQDGTPDDA